MTESFARHLMVAFDRWQTDGFASLAHQYLALLPRDENTSRRIEANGDLVVQQIGAEKAAPQSLAKVLAKPSWLDPGTPEGRACEAAAHHRARSVGYVCVRRCGRARRLGGVGGIPLLRPRSGDA